jgi:hypothetical protein
MSLDPRHQSGRPILDRKQTLADSHSRHNPFSILLRQLFPTANRDTGKGIYYNIFDPRLDNNLDDNSDSNASNRSRNVINFDDYRARTSSDRMSARDSGSHPSALRSSGIGRLGSPDRMARISMPARSRLKNGVLFAAATRSPSASRTLRSSRISRLVRKPIQPGSEHQSSSLALQRIRKTTLDSLNDHGGWR